MSVCCEIFLCLLEVKTRRNPDPSFLTALPPLTDIECASIHYWHLDGAGHRSASDAFQSPLSSPLFMYQFEVEFLVIITSQLESLL